MSDIEYGDAEEISANSEVRIITLELMKIAHKQKKPFPQVAKEYIQNVYLLRRLLEDQKE